MELGLAIGALIKGNMSGSHMLFRIKKSDSLAISSLLRCTFVKLMTDIPSSVDMAKPGACVL